MCTLNTCFPCRSLEFWSAPGTGATLRAAPSRNSGHKATNKLPDGDASRALSQLRAGGVEHFLRASPGRGPWSWCLISRDFTPCAFPLADFSLHPFITVNRSHENRHIPSGVPAASQGCHCRCQQALLETQLTVCSPELEPQQNTY